MVRVFYEPPPGGPRSHLNRGAYYIESEATPAILKRMQRMNPAIAITASVCGIAALCYLPLSKYIRVMFCASALSSGGICDGFCSLSVAVGALHFH